MKKTLNIVTGIATLGLIVSGISAAAAVGAGTPSISPMHGTINPTEQQVDKSVNLFIKSGKVFLIFGAILVASLITGKVIKK